MRLRYGSQYYTSTCPDIRLWLGTRDEPDVYLRKKTPIRTQACRVHLTRLHDEDKDKYFKKSELKARSGNMSSFGGPSSVGVRMLTPLMSTSWSLALDGVVSLADHLKGIAHYAKYIL
ncbi:hypothetical protein MPH_01606 [Macrophomina phaseolina MS6]|uniref:Uncharacterized protein n=1 Tax=Macrophomina phaseolina (strain MS6) TaxID=1126212 RepID=K2S837_MACPH|nr:hypothetical protein MPH_01606 [Macrophomina phaseolina MS6]